MAFLTAVIVGLLLILVFSIPNIISNLRDIDPVALTAQSSLSATRKEKESAIYRSVDVPHGLPLNTGLRIQHGYNLRDGNLKDIWFTALKENKTTLRFGDTGQEYSLQQINCMIHQLSSSLQELTSCKNIGILSDFDSLGSLLVLFDSFFVSDRTIVSFNSIPKVKKADLDVIVVDYSKLEMAFRFGFKKIVVIGDCEIPSLPDVFSVIKMSSLVRLKDPESNDSFDYTPKDFEDKINNQPYSEINNFKEYKYFQRNFVSSVASQLMSLSSEHTWAEKDKLLICVSSQDVTSKNNMILKLLSGLISQVGHVTIINEDEVSLSQIVKLNPTILSSTDTTLYNLIPKKSTYIGNIILDRANYLNSIGIFNKVSKCSSGLNLRLVYSQQTSSPLNSLQYTQLKSLLHSRIIREKSIVGSMGPILKTNLFDYRVLQNEQTKKLTVTQLGVSSNSLEMKIVKNQETDKIGKLMIRGFNLCKFEGMYSDDEMWCDSGLVGKFGSDGCFYQYTYL
ncbi:hypothetical protein CANARDRAFT_5973 [[Candida] arabinofermentans NRRL YB-2248]|uniref:AMP-dependent synthetase/ligase domain-containing protein n=1 Tax=[Candida] arabinofermentans NRRL YB-2248 TaxID=983967 RepID=A0A1E4T6T0_9ASCO|nr:hypothetical protein CANARDRAFT_5973 [[Candida] arabinofermentans NRRL YB-2248]